MRSPLEVLAAAIYARLGNISGASVYHVAPYDPNFPHITLGNWINRISPHKGGQEHIITVMLIVVSRQEETQQEVFDLVDKIIEEFTSSDWSLGSSWQVIDKPFPEEIRVVSEVGPENIVRQVGYLTWRFALLEL